MNILLDRSRIKRDLLDFTIRGVDKFLKENHDLVFYAFAFDCNAEYGEVNLCFNTEDEFSKTLRYYQEGEYAQNYQLENDIKELKYNTGDWKYQCFETMYIMEEEEMARLYSTDINSQINDFITIFCEAILDFTTTKEYKDIPKTNDFKILCLDHDENLEEAENRLQKIKDNYKS